MSGSREVIFNIIITRLFRSNIFNQFNNNFKLTKSKILKLSLIILDTKNIYIDNSESFIYFRDIVI